MILQRFATALQKDGNHQVIFYDQPKYTRGEKLSALDHQAEAALSVLEAEGLANTPIYLAAHSMGFLTMVRMAELAKQRGITALDSSKGSRSVAIAPAGTNTGENLGFLAGRFIFYF